MLRLVTLDNVYRKLRASFSLPDIPLFPLTPRSVLLPAMQSPATTLLPEAGQLLNRYITSYGIRKP